MDTKALYSLSYGLFVLSTRIGDKDNACIVNTAQQSAGEPLTIGVSVNKANLTCDMINYSKVFNLSVLDKTAPFELFKRFGFQSGRDADKFDGIRYSRSANGLCYLPEHCCAFMSCKVRDSVDLGSHIMFFGDMTDAGVLSSAEPCTYAYYHSNIKNAPQKKTGYVCRICGYVYEGENLPPDFVCPVCKHGSEDFEKIV